MILSGAVSDGDLVRVDAAGIESGTERRLVLSTAQ